MKKLVKIILGRISRKLQRHHCHHRTAQKWHQLFQQFPKKDTRSMFKLMSFILSIPTSNCFPERVFSQMNLKWSDARNKCSVNLMKAELFIQFNLQLSCEEFFIFIKEKKETLKEVNFRQKYHE